MLNPRLQRRRCSVFPVYFHRDPRRYGCSNPVTTMTRRPAHTSGCWNALPIIIFHVLTNSAPLLTTVLFIAQLVRFCCFFFLWEQRENGCFVERVSRGSDVIWIFRLSVSFSFSRQSHQSWLLVVLFFLRCVSAYRRHFSWLLGLHIKKLSVKLRLNFSPAGQVLSKCCVLCMNHQQRGWKKNLQLT